MANPNQAKEKSGKADTSPKKLPLEKTMDLAEGEEETVDEALRQHEQKDEK